MRQNIAVDLFLPPSIRAEIGPPMRSGGDFISRCVWARRETWIKNPILSRSGVVRATRMSIVDDVSRDAPFIS